MHTTSNSSNSRLVLVDIENQAGTNPLNLSTHDLVDLLLTTQEFLDLDDTDSVIVASNPAWKHTIRTHWTGCQVRTRPGKDGADKELCAAATPRRISRYHALWIVSGDHAFIKTAETARSLNKRTVVVARPTSLHAGLRKLADNTIAFNWNRRSTHLGHAA